jgi:hypothetical protein
MRALTRAFALLVLFVVPPGTARAQQSDQIPRELALALIPFGGTDGGEIIVGQIPADLASTFTLPPSGRVLGSFVSLTVTQVVMTLPTTADSASAFARRSLEAHGWTARVMPTMQRGGLQYGSPRSSMPSIYCKGDSPDAISIATQFHGQSTLLRLTRNTGSSICDATRLSGVLSSSATFGTATGTIQRSMTVDQRMAEMPMASVPPLWSPGDVRASQVCRSFNGMNTESQSQPLRTELSPQEILAHYGRQLDSAGRKTTNSRSNAAGTWANPKDGQEVTVEITKLPTQAGCYEVTLTATARRSPR